MFARVFVCIDFSSENAWTHAGTARRFCFLWEGRSAAGAAWRGWRALPSALQASQDPRARRAAKIRKAPVPEH